MRIETSERCKECGAFLTFDGYVFYCNECGFWFRDNWLAKRLFGKM